jgi:hypothetical protein
LAAYSSSLISYGVRIGERRPPPTKPKVQPPISTRCPSSTVVPGPAYSDHRVGMSTLPYVAYVGVGNAANISAYCLRMAFSIAEPRSTPAQSRLPNSRASS